MCVRSISPGGGKRKTQTRDMGRHFFTHSASINTCEISKVPFSDEVCSEREQKKQDPTLQTGNLKAYLGKKNWLPTEVLHNQKFWIMTSSNLLLGNNQCDQTFFGQVKYRDLLNKQLKKVAILAIFTNKFSKFSRSRKAKIAKIAINLKVRSPWHWSNVKLN